MASGCTEEKQESACAASILSKFEVMSYPRCSFCRARPWAHPKQRNLAYSNGQFQPVPSLRRFFTSVVSGLTVKRLILIKSVLMRRTCHHVWEYSNQRFSPSNANFPYLEAFLTLKESYSLYPAARANRYRLKICTNHLLLRISAIKWISGSSMSLPSYSPRLVLTFLRASCKYHLKPLRFHKTRKFELMLSGF